MLYKMPNENIFFFFSPLYKTKFVDFMEDNCAPLQGGASIPDFNRLLISRPYLWLYRAAIYGFL